MKRSKITSIVAITIAAALLASSIAIASPVFAKKDSDSSVVVALVAVAVVAVALVAVAVVAVHPRVIMTNSRNVFLMMRQAVLRQNSK